MPVTFGQNGAVLVDGMARAGPLGPGDRMALSDRRVRRTGRAYWITTATLTFLAPLILLSLSLLDGLDAQRMWAGMGLAVSFTLIALPFSFLVIAPLVALTALPFAQVVKHTRAEHAGAFVAVATGVAMALPVVFTAMAGELAAATALQLLGAIAWFAPFGAFVGAVFWRVYAGAWIWRIEEPERVADVF